MCMPQPPQVGLEHVGQVVRCLFAGMPNGKHITPHHDNGLWVSRTHRVHIPVSTNSGVIFNVGPTFEDMSRVAFNEGCVVELNNASPVLSLHGLPFQIQLLLLLLYLFTEALEDLHQLCTTGRPHSDVS